MKGTAVFLCLLLQLLLTSCQGTSSLEPDAVSTQPLPPSVSQSAQEAFVPELEPESGPPPAPPSQPGFDPLSAGYHEI